MSEQIDDVIVVGGGLAGLAAATFLARAGRKVRLLERAEALGGRARSQAHAGYWLNQGAHALYRGGRGIEVLRALGVPVRGSSPGRGSFARIDGALRPLPQGALSVLTSDLLSWSGRVQVASLLARVRAHAAASEGTTEEAWLDAHVTDPTARRLLAALVRVSTYANDPAHHSAGAALAQMARALDGVLYLDGGWQTLVEGLRAAAQGAGVAIACGEHARVASVEHDGSVRGVRLADGALLRARAVVIAAGPSVAASLAGEASPSLRAFAERARPVRAACLDVALARLPNPRVLFTLGFDAPLYFSVHSDAARLAPPGGAVVHAARYLAPGDRGDERELEALFDLAQPGWREHVVERRFLPKLCVSHALVTAPLATRGRPSPRVPEIDGLYVAGDWVGEDGMLADAALASARRASELLLEGAPVAPSSPRSTRDARARTTDAHSPIDLR